MANSTVNVQSPNEDQHSVISSLLDMQLQCGGWGLIVLVLWALTIFWNQPELHFFGPLGAWIVGIAMLFLFAGLLSVIGRHSPKSWPKVVLFICGLICILASGAFIYLSGGPYSPVTAFYVMTFTLTLSNSKRSVAIWRFFQFATILSLAFLLGERPQFADGQTGAKVSAAVTDPKPVDENTTSATNPGKIALSTFRYPIPASTLGNIVESPVYYWAVAFGSLLSMLVASLSRFFQDRNKPFEHFWSAIDRRITAVVGVLYRRKKPPYTGS